MYCTGTFVKSGDARGTPASFSFDSGLLLRNESDATSESMNPTVYLPFNFQHSISSDSASNLNHHLQGFPLFTDWNRENTQERMQRSDFIQTYNQFGDTIRLKQTAISGDVPVTPTESHLADARLRFSPKDCPSIHHNDSCNIQSRLNMAATLPPASYLAPAGSTAPAFQPDRPWASLGEPVSSVGQPTEASRLHDAADLRHPPAVAAVHDTGQVAGANPSCGSELFAGVQVAASFVRELVQGDAAAAAASSFSTSPSQQVDPTSSVQIRS